MRATTGTPSTTATQVSAGVARTAYTATARMTTPKIPMRVRPSAASPANG
ncbi:hypothetical protein [Nostocoides sp. HKS02]|nr:hypothetical protein [Tetrasphaera sp. HKS02]